MTIADRTNSLEITRLANLDLVEAWSKGTPDDRVRFAFPIAAPATKSIALAYAELRPGGAIPWHIDSAAEEILLVLDGCVEVSLEMPEAQETVSVDAGCALCFAAGQAHRVSNAGPTAARTVHVFGASGVAVTFADALMPMDLRSIGQAS